MAIRMLVIVADQAKCDLLVDGLSRYPGLQIVGRGAALADAYLSGPQAYCANLIAVDLASPEVEQSGFWTAIHAAYPAANLMALVEQPVSELAWQAALHAGVHCFAQWIDPFEKWWEAAQAVDEGRRFYSAR